MNLEVLHRTAYAYAELVSVSHHVARLGPRDDHRQRTSSFDVTVTPTPSAVRSRLDAFGNRILHFSLGEPHATLDVVARTSVAIAPSPPPAGLTASPSVEAVRAAVRRPHRRDLLDACTMVFDSPHVATSEALAAYALPSFAPGRPLLEATLELMHRIHAEFTYDTRATTIATPLVEVLERRRGVCQDFAHLAIGCLRSLRLPARYVSGYLLTHPPPGQPKLVGADASHAWFSVFVPDAGWFDFDPTNDLVPSDEHVSVAVGRDYDDVTPIRGVIQGGGAHEVTVQVDVRVASTEAPAPA
jgi:transglutaminase-like putative cysteine protease